MLNLGEIRDRVVLYLRGNNSAIDSAFTTAQYDQYINDCYIQEVNHAKSEGLKSAFRSTATYTWPASQTTANLPANLARRSVERMWDVTDGTPGYPIDVGQDGRFSLVFWKDRNTLQWGDSGPSTQRTIRFDYMAVPTPLVSDEDVPELIHEQFHEMLVWAAAIQARIVADEQVPQTWTMRLQEFRDDYWDTLSRGRPSDSVVTIRPVDDSLYDLPYYVDTLSYSSAEAADGTSLTSDGAEEPSGTL